jgi:uncharacterized delta-60 repeat protein
MTMVVARYLPNGSLDPSFGAAGIVRTNFPGQVRKVFDIMVTSQNRITVAATDGDNLLIASYLVDGNLNTAFSQDGRARLPFPFIPHDATFESLDPVVVSGSEAVVAGPLDPSPELSQARIVAAGGNETPLNGRFTLARYRPFDRVDQTFGPSGNGFIFTDFLGEGDGRALSVRVDRQHRTIAAGSVRAVADDSTHFAVARYLSNGTLDTSFSGDGRVVTRFAGGRSEAAAITFGGGQGRVVVVGRVTENVGRSFALLRYLDNGDLDTGFSGDGRIVTRFPEGDSEARAVVTDGRGRIVACGFAGTTFALARYLRNGALDTSFGGDGRVTASIPGSSHSGANALIVSATDETITAVGAASAEFAVARFRDGGTLDPTFSGDGRVLTVIGSNTESSTAQAIAMDSQRRLIVAGVLEPLEP